MRKYFGTIPTVFRRQIVMEDMGWRNELLLVTEPAYDLDSEILNPRVRAYVALAAASVVGWEEGILLHAKAAQSDGAKTNEAHDVIRSVFKTTVSNSMAAGFRSPFHIPYAAILSSYVENGTLPRRKGDRLITPTMQG